VYNETDEERKKREAEEAKKKEDEDKQTNFDKVRKEGRNREGTSRCRRTEASSSAMKTTRRQPRRSWPKKQASRNWPMSRRRRQPTRLPKPSKRRPVPTPLRTSLKKIADQQEADWWNCQDDPQGQAATPRPGRPGEKRLAQAKYAASTDLIKPGQVPGIR